MVFAGFINHIYLLGLPRLSLFIKSWKGVHPGAWPRTNTSCTQSKPRTASTTFSARGSSVTTNLAPTSSARLLISLAKRLRVRQAQHPPAFQTLKNAIGTSMKLLEISRTTSFGFNPRFIKADVALITALSNSLYFIDLPVPASRCTYFSIMKILPINL